MITPNSVISASPRQVSCVLAEGKAILQLESGIYYGLDAVGSRVWDLVQSPATVRGIVDVITSEYQVDRERCEGDVIRLLEDLARHALVEVSSPA